MSIEQTLHPREKDLGGGFRVRRVLPSSARRSIGPFLFLDHFGPVMVRPGDRRDVRPHPHIGLATVTYLFEGAIMHRDSLGSVQRIEPGAINWMTAGRGIVHSERVPADLRERSCTSHGLQLWVALPQAFEECAPRFEHTEADALPSITIDGVAVRVLLGQAFGAVSPVETLGETLYLDIRMPAGGSIALPGCYPERAIYGVDHPLVVDGEALPAHTLGVLRSGEEVRVSADEAARFVVIGGAPLDGPRYMWWNFVSSRKERIREAADAWANGQMGGVPGDDERIPLPDSRFA